MENLRKVSESWRVNLMIMSGIGNTNSKANCGYKEEEWAV